MVDDMPNHIHEDHLVVQNVDIWDSLERPVDFNQWRTFFINVYSFLNLEFFFSCNIWWFYSGYSGFHQFFFLVLNSKQ